MNATEQFKDVMRAEGLQPPDYIEPGKLHRFSTNGARADTSGWCKMFEDERGGVFGDWRTGTEQTWQAKHDRQQSPAEREAFRRKVEEDRQRRQQDLEKKHDAAALQAKEEWKRCVDVDSHPYLDRKGIKTQAAKICTAALSINGTNCKGALALHFVNVAGEIRSLQFINAAGEKRYLTGGERVGTYHPI
jgi:putative DNA primase/helicase